MCRHVLVTMRDALWSVDAAQAGRDLRGAEIRMQVGRDAASRKSVALAVAAPATGTGKGTVALLVEAKRVRGGLPLVFGSDNGSENVNRDVAEFLEREHVIHLKNLPRTPQHNARAERAIGELRAESGLRANEVVPPENAVARGVEHEVLAYLGRGGVRAKHRKRSKGARGAPAAVEAGLAALRDLVLECCTIDRRGVERPTPRGGNGDATRRALAP